MLVDQNLSNFSDLSFRTALVLYVISLFLSLFYYVRIQAVIDARRALKKEAAVGATRSGDVLLEERPSNLQENAEKAEATANKIGGMLQSLLWIGIAVHVVAIVLRGLSAHRFPFGNLYEYVLMVTAGVMIVSSIALQRKEWRTLWPWILVPVLALMFFGGTKLYAESAPVVPALRSYWLPVHVSVVSLGAAIGIFSGLSSLLSILRSWQPKGKEHGVIGGIVKPLPTATKLDTLAYRTAVITLPTLGLGIVLGAIWAEAAWGRYWGWDPKETVSFATWVLYAAYLHARATPSMRKAAPWINIVAMATMVFNLFFINMVVSGLHSYAGLN
ncbi:c-type cytochrome biogenesis protein CcsB [Corynebacterium sp. SA-MJD20WY100]|uniref:c-type cytochrome biogenesis protein CcsB n=1 Tax=Corynebacterium sp. SA-MJD20WY100 TaxID=3142969 RepID=UPI003221EFB5